MTCSLPPILEQRVFGIPVPQARPKTRLFKNPHSPLGVTASHYDPANCKDWKRTVLAQCLDRKPEAPVEGALSLTLRFYLPRPESLPKRVVHHVRRPDLDNLSKAIKDALKGVIYRDDSQIARLDAEKDYSMAPGVFIRLERLILPLTPEAPRPQQPDLITAPA